MTRLYRGARLRRAPRRTLRRSHRRPQPRAPVGPTRSWQPPRSARRWLAAGSDVVFGVSHHHDIGSASGSVRPASQRGHTNDFRARFGVVAETAVRRIESAPEAGRRQLQPRSRAKVARRRTHSGAARAEAINGPRDLADGSIAPRGEDLLEMSDIGPLKSVSIARSSSGRLARRSIVRASARSVPPATRMPSVARSIACNWSIARSSKCSSPWTGRGSFEREHRAVDIEQDNSSHALGLYQSGSRRGSCDMSATTSSTVAAGPSDLPRRRVHACPSHAHRRLSGDSSSASETARVATGVARDLPSGGGTVRGSRRSRVFFGAIPLWRATMALGLRTSGCVSASAGKRSFRCIGVRLARKRFAGRIATIIPAFLPFWGVTSREKMGGTTEGSRTGYANIGRQARLATGPTRERMRTPLPCR